ncbi:MAG: TerB family tellurite resistance protein [Alphaproteobacteria bacterium]|nr:TerB family tellurite resistance protein [Alphaproteobacteria bacterium]
MSENDNNFTARMNDEDKIAFLKVLSVLAKSDHHFDDDQKEKIQDTALIFGISAERIPEILQEESQEKVLQRVSQIKNRHVALALIREMCFLANSDRDLSDEEVMFIGKVGEAMGVELEKIEQISQWVIDHIILQEQKKLIFETN